MSDQHTAQEWRRARRLARRTGVGMIVTGCLLELIPGFEVAGTVLIINGLVIEEAGESAAEATEFPPGANPELDKEAKKIIDTVKNWGDAEWKKWEEKASAWLPKK